MPDFPILAHKETIVSSLKERSTLILRAPTGSGKSTQIPQIIRDSGICSGTVLILQPRRIAARMLATYIASHRNSILGKEVGYSTRFDSAVSGETRMLFITEGILPRLLLKDANLSGIETIIFDEFHERSITTDLGLALIRNLQKQRSDLRIIVMSATLETSELTEYLPDAICIDAPGRTYPVEIQYLPYNKDTPVWDTATRATDRLLRSGNSGDILIFMPGAYEIRKTIDAIETGIRSEPISVVPLYGDLPEHLQQQALSQSASGRRKIIVATNIAQTSLTIPGVRHVIDSGLARVNRYDSSRGLNTLYTETISADAAQQRAGRAGREAPGICIRLWSLTQQQSLASCTTPEILRIDLSEVLLTLMSLGYNDLQHFPWLTSPPPAAITAAQELLNLLGAINSESQLTEIGKQMSSFPMHPRFSRLLLSSIHLDAITLATFAAAMLGERSMIQGKPQYPDEAYESSVITDFYAYYLLFEKARASSFSPATCSRYALNISVCKSIERSQNYLIQLCKKYTPVQYNDGTSVEGFAESLLLAYPDHLVARRDSGTLQCAMRNNRRGELDSSTIVRKAPLCIASDIRETRHSAGQVLKPQLSMICEIRPEWLNKHFNDSFSKATEYTWNNITQSVEASERSFYLDVLISEKPAQELDIQAASNLLAETIISKKLPLRGWDHSVDEWINRVVWVRETFPEKNLPQFTDEEKHLVIHTLCDGSYRYSQVCDIPVLPFLMELLSSSDNAFIESMAPASVMLPTGRKMKLLYTPGKPPHGRTRIQDLYGQNQTPRIASGRASVTIEILAPNNRPVQITDDLKNFWEVHYPELKKTLSRRYPKHEWR
jgi:ATP-dependent helicase HrpB